MRYAIFPRPASSGTLGHLIVLATRDSSSAKEKESNLAVSDDDGNMLIALSLRVSGLILLGVTDERLISILVCSVNQQ